MTEQSKPSKPTAARAAGWRCLICDRDNDVRTTICACGNTIGIADRDDWKKRTIKTK